MYKIKIKSHPWLDSQMCRGLQLSVTMVTRLNTYMTLQTFICFMFGILALPSKHSLVLKLY